jgi:hypothetical protein
LLRRTRGVGSTNKSPRAVNRSPRSLSAIVAKAEILAGRIQSISSVRRLLVARYALRRGVSLVDVTA